MATMGFNVLLKEKGYNLKDLTIRLWTTKGTCISYPMLSHYNRACDLSYGRAEVWKDILECLTEMGIKCDLHDQYDELNEGKAGG